MPLYSIDGHPQTIHYLSSLPGGGKTHWAIRVIQNRIRTGSGVTIYTAPTHKLLDEIGHKIRMGVDPALHPRIFKINDDLKKSLGLNTLREVAKVLMRAVSKSIRINNIEVPKLERGTVIMMAHETFLRLDSGYKENGKSLLPNRKRVSVIFDEAQKCVLQSEQMILPPELEGVLSKFLPLQELHEARTPIEIKSKLTRKELDDALQSYVAQYRLTPKVDRMFKDLKRVMEHVYGSAVRVMGQAQYNPRTCTLQLQTVLDPARVFYGWKTVTIMAARLENTQMFHMLRLSGYEPLDGEDNDLFERRIQDIDCPIHLEQKRVPSIQIQERALRRAWSQAYITYASAGQSKLSMGLLDNGIVVRPEPGDNLDLWSSGLMELNAAPGAGLKPNILRNLIRGIAKVKGYSGTSRFRTNNEDLIAYIKTLPDLQPYTPIQYLLKRSVDINRAWNKAQGNYDPTPLLATINVGDGSYEREAELLKFGADDIIFVPFKSQGSNAYIEHHVFAFLASVNPHPGAKTVMEALCPSYNSDLDHLVDQAVQSLTRSSIRVPDMDAYRLLILPDKASAENVKKFGFSDLPTLIEPWDIGNLGIGNGLTKEDTKDLRNLHSIIALKFQKRQAGNPVATKKRGTKFAAKKKFLIQKIPQYKEIVSLKRRLAEKRASHDQDRLRDDLKTLESALADQIKLCEVQFERRWKAGDSFFKPEL